MATICALIAISIAAAIVVAPKRKSRSGDWASRLPRASSRGKRVTDFVTPEIDSSSVFPYFQEIQVYSDKHPEAATSPVFGSSAIPIPAVEASEFERMLLGALHQGASIDSHENGR